MIRFLLKGLLRDKSRSLVPMLVVAIGVMLAVFLQSYVKGLMGDLIEQTANFSTGHMKVTTAAYAENMDQMPNDLALLGVTELVDKLEHTFPQVEWETRIRFGGLIDVPDENGETRSQGPAVGMGIDLLSENSNEVKRLNLAKSLVRGSLPDKAGEVLLSEDFSQKLEVNPGDELTLIGSTMNGGMAIYNFLLSGTVRFGTTALDRGTIIADLADVQRALDMTDGASEILGFLKGGYYSDENVAPIVAEFNKTFFNKDDEFSPVIMRLRDQEGMGLYVDLSKSMGTIVIFVFIVAMSLVLWNAGLLGGLRRYGEIGIRLAMGEEKGHVYRSMIYEAVMIGIMGTILGTGVGLFFAWLMQEYGLDISEFTKNSTSGVMLPNVIKTHITPATYYIGLIPGLISTVVGTMLAGIGIYKRKTAQLFKELEA